MVNSDGGVSLTPRNVPSTRKDSARIARFYRHPCCFAGVQLTRLLLPRSHNSTRELLAFFASCLLYISLIYLERSNKIVIPSSTVLRLPPLSSHFFIRPTRSPDVYGSPRLFRSEERGKIHATKHSFPPRPGLFLTLAFPCFPFPFPSALFYGGSRFLSNFSARPPSRRSAFATAFAQSVNASA